MVRYVLILTLFCLGLSAGAQLNRQALIQRGGLTGSPPPFPGALAGMPGNQNAYGLWRLSNAYNGALIRVRRETDNQLALLGFDANSDIDETALLAFKGAGKLYCMTLFNQVTTDSLTQTNTALQMEVVKLTLPSGRSRWVLKAEAGKYYTLVGSSLNTLHYTQATVTVVMWPGLVADPNAVYGLVGNNGTASANRGYSLYWEDRAAVPRNNALFSQITRAVSNSFVSATDNNDVAAANTVHVISNVIDPANATAANRSLLWVDGTQLPATNTATATLSTLTPTYALQVGAAGNNALPFVGYFMGVVFHNTTQTAAAITTMQTRFLNYY